MLMFLVGDEDGHPGFYCNPECSLGNLSVLISVNCNVTCFRRLNHQTGHVDPSLAHHLVVENVAVSPQETRTGSLGPALISLDV